MSLSKINTEIMTKIKRLSDEISCTEWRDAAVILQKNSPELATYLARLKERFWHSDKIGTKAMCYADPHIRDEKLHEVDGEIKLKEEYMELYDPVQACWRELQQTMLIPTLPHWATPQRSIEDVFEDHLFFGVVTYQWAISVSAENQVVALRAMTVASGLLDMCTGMVWVKTFWEKEKKLSTKRASAGRKGGKGKAEIYEIIQGQLAKILYKHGAKSGWKSKTAAVDDVIEPLWLFVQKTECKISSSSKQHRIATMDKEALRDTILKQWSTKVDIVREAFEATVTRKKRDG